MTLVPFFGDEGFFFAFLRALPLNSHKELIPCQGVGQRPTVLDFLRRNTKWQKKRNL